VAVLVLVVFAILSIFAAAARGQFLAQVGPVRL
jgi:hypothetical protein